MTMRGYDISNHQGHRDINQLIRDSDFLILKATEGVNYRDAYFRGWADKCLEKTHPFGFYHFARANDPVRECDFFLEVTRDYHLAGIPVLDWEVNQSVEWVNRFVSHYHANTGVWPWIYANPWRFNQGGVNPNCARWAAAYQKNPPKCDIPIAAWQYTSTPLDANYFYGDSSAWRMYATGGRGGESDMTNDQSAKLDAIYTEIMRDDDPTGRDMIMRDHDHIKWIAGSVREVNDKLDALADKIAQMCDNGHSGQGGGSCCK